MGAYIDIIRKPDSCYNCRLLLVCYIGQQNGWIDNKRDDNCPVIWTDDYKGVTDGK